MKSFCDGLKAAVLGESFLSGAHTSLSITPADEGMDTGVILSKALGVFGLVLFSCHGKLRSWKKGSLTSWFPFQSRMLEFPWAPDLPVFLQHMASFRAGGNTRPVLYLTPAFPPQPQWVGP